MHRLASSPLEFMPDGRRWPAHAQSQLAVMWHVLSRHVKKYLGWPATPDAAVLIDMVAALKAATEEALGATQNVTAAVLVGPDGVRLTAEETDDVLEFLGVRNLMRDGADDWTYRWENGNLFAAGAAWAGIGKGLCKSYLDGEKCAKEEGKMATKRVLVVEYTLNGLSLAADDVTTAQPGPRRRAMDRTATNWDLGFGQTKDQKYWDTVQRFVRDFVEKSEIGKVDEVVLTGESAGDGRFKEAVKEGLGTSVSSKSVLKKLAKEPEKDPLYVVALGAAEIAKRKQEGMGRCVRDKGSCKPKARDEL